MATTRHLGLDLGGTNIKRAVVGRDAPRRPGPNAVCRFFGTTAHLYWSGQHVVRPPTSCPARSAAARPGRPGRLPTDSELHDADA